MADDGMGQDMAKVPDFGVGADLNGIVHKRRGVKIVVTVVSDSDGFGVTVFSDSIVGRIIGSAHRVPLVLIELMRPLSIFWISLIAF